MLDSTQKRENALAVATLLEDARSMDTVVLDVHESCSFSDYFVITTVNSQGHLRGLMPQLDELFRERDILPFHPRKRGSDIGWVLIDLGYAVIHLMTEELREFYDLERLWFGAQKIYPTQVASQTQ
ncbi:MAG: ribosome silencing factor [Spirochaetales bacterium]|nr:MAG: ribosome silencing factor [Spirochaetales bacterium]